MIYLNLIQGRKDDFVKIVYASVDCPKDNKSETHDQELMNAYDMLAAFFVQVIIINHA